MIRPISLTCLVLPLLAACTNPPPQPVDPAGYIPLDYEPPLALRALLPRGVPPSDLREDDGCYGYALNGQVFPVQRPDGGQYCIG
ncbi:MAG: hypothetical protein AAF919_02090 [Pseudomonadota bacterium]